jgi:Mn-dependent DtxR family transcriptional regulator
MDLTQEFLADMLGCQRPTVSVAAEELQRRGLIEYNRGTIRILDRDALKQAACECYRVVSDHLANYTEMETGFGG